MGLISPSLYMLPLGIANAYLMCSNDALVLVDAGVQRSLTRLEHLLKRNGFGWRDLTHVFFTHAHPDHVGDFPEIALRSGAPVWAHRLEAPILRGQPVVLPDPRSIRPVDRALKWLIDHRINEVQAKGSVQGEFLGDEHLSHIIPDLRVVPLPGHSAGHIGFYHKGEGWLIAGDALMNLVGLTFPMAGYTADAQTAWRSILRIATIEPKLLALGHGPVFRKSLQPMAARARLELEKFTS
jgi:glyoxylase-like metal-dependent hydrolase (beta-lactamase superfamily II)